MMPEVAEEIAIVAADMAKRRQWGLMHSRTIREKTGHAAMSS